MYKYFTGLKGILRFFSDKKNAIACEVLLDIFSNFYAKHGKHQIETILENNFYNSLQNRASIMQSINNNTITGYDSHKKSVLVFFNHYRNIEHFNSLLNYLKSKDYQIIYVTVWSNMNAVFCMQNDIPALYANIFLGQYELEAQRDDFAMLFMTLFKNFNIEFILQDEWTSHPLRGFYQGWPKFSDCPPIFCMRHSLSTFYEMPNNQKEFYEKNIMRYFVWGNYHKKFFYKQSDKVIPSGYNKLDSYNGIDAKEDNEIFCVGNHIYLDSQISWKRIIHSLLTDSDAIIKYKPHPDERTYALENFRNEILADLSLAARQRFIMLDQYEPYIHDLSSCRLVVSFGSNLVADALALDKSVCLLPSNYARDPIYTMTPGNVLLLPSNIEPNAKNILAHAERVRASRDRVLEFRAGLLSHLFTSTTFIYDAIISES